MDAGHCRTALHYIEELTKVISHNVTSVEGDLVDTKTLINQVLQVSVL